MLSDQARLTARRLAVGLLLAVAAVGLACKETPQRDESPRQGALDKSQLCAGGGATFDEARRECVCPEGKQWDGSRCEASADQQPQGESAAAKCAASAGDWDAESSSCACPAGTILTDERCTAAADTGGGGDYDAARVAAACQRAKGSWNGDEAYCFCSDEKVLVGRSCLRLSGRVTDEVCARAVFPGQWRRERCECAADDDVFSPARGGCAPVRQGSETMLRRLCESSLNKGKWDGVNDRCLCPGGRLWNDELCVVQEDLSSKEVCESDFNKGAWDSDKKRCACKLGSIWIDQQCRSMTAVTNQEACEAELNDGRWDAALNTCICPGLAGWAPALKTCEEGHLSAAQQLCTQSGGVPGSVAGNCACGEGLKVQVLAPQNYQYCVRADSSDNQIPKWLLIMLGLLTQ
jgi:hypothetical protein